MSNNPLFRPNLSRVSLFLVFGGLIISFQNCGTGYRATGIESSTSSTVNDSGGTAGDSSNSPSTNGTNGTNLPSGNPTKVSSIKLAWDQVVDARVTSLRLYKAEGNGTFSLVQELQPTLSAFEVGSLNVGTQYHFVITSFDASAMEESAYSNEVTYTP